MISTMQILKKPAKLLGYSILIGAIFIGYLSWAVEINRYKCEGEGQYGDAFALAQNLPAINNLPERETGFLRIIAYSKLSLLFADSRHEVFWESIDRSDIQLWHNIEDQDLALDLKHYDGVRQGSFSDISNALRFDNGIYKFIGLCKKVDQQ